jgi:hypothetical protein
MLSLQNRRAKGRLAVAVAVAVAVGCALLAFSGAAVAQDDDDATFEQKIIRGLLGGNQKNLEYRERSPLVIPPSRELPPPESGASLQRAPAWPSDPDQRKRAATGSIFGADEQDRGSARLSTPDELRRGTAAGRGRVEQPAVTLSDNEASRPLRPSELGGKNITLFNIFDNKAPETEKFTSEPVRTRMTEPPAGYRTPAPTQPYAPPKETGGWFKLPDPWARGTGEVK